MAKLRAMSAREIAARVQYTGYLAYERALHRRGQLTNPDRLRDALVPTLVRDANWEQTLAARTPTAAFFASIASPEQTRSLFDARYAAEWQKARKCADDTAAGHIGFFGREFSFGPTIDWHADPVTGAAWPRRFHADVPVNGGNVGFGDVKDVWEINRHQFFVDLAKIAFLDRSSRHAEALRKLLDHWMAEVPYGTGAAWACALEPAFRTWSWLWAYHLVRAADLLDPATHALWLTGFYDHGRFIHRHLERYSSPYNHLIGEASALFALGVLFPEFRDAPAWAARGRDILESTLSDQFYADGGSVEQSTFYHHATLGFYLLSAILARNNRVDLSRNVWDAVERGIAFSAALVQPDGRLPRIGGADDGKPIRMEHLPFWDFRSYQAIGAVLFERPDFRFVADRFWEDAAWILGPDGASAFDRLPLREPETVSVMPASGYCVVRSDWSKDADYLCFDCGPQAAGLRRDDVPSAAHGHADCLSVVLSLGGREVLVDPGFYCYNGDPLWEVHFRKTRAHSTILVDDVDQSRHVSKMAWTHTYAPKFEGAASGGLGWASGSHDGYARQPNGVTHRRTAWLRADGYLVLRDELSGVPGHTAEAIFQFAPGTVTLNETSALFDDRFELIWIACDPVKAQVACGGNDPSAGWIATSLGVRQPAPRLTVRFEMRESHTMLLTVLVDRYRCATMPAGGRDARSNDVLRAHVTGNGWTDEIISAVRAPVAIRDIHTDAPLVILRSVHGSVTEALQAGGTRLETPGVAPSMSIPTALAIV